MSAGTCAHIHMSMQVQTQMHMHSMHAHGYRWGAQDMDVNMCMCMCIHVHQRHERMFVRPEHIIWVGIHMLCETMIGLVGALACIFLHIACAKHFSKATLPPITKQRRSGIFSKSSREKPLEPERTQCLGQRQLALPTGECRARASKLQISFFSGGFVHLAFHTSAP